MSKPVSFREALLSGRTLLADGATGTMLQREGLAPGEAPERWTLEKPDAIAGLARGYIAAGSDLVLTNTFGANTIRMRLCGLQSRVAELNREAARLARREIDAAGRRVYLVGSIGPTGEMVEPYGDLSADQARAAFLDQARALVAAGVDGLVCETFTALEEATLALDAAREAGGDLPLVASMAFDAGGRTMMGVTPEDAVASLSAAGALAVGANCSVGPTDLEKVIRAMHLARPGIRLWAKPNAGLPHIVDGRTAYDVNPADLASFAARMRDLGVAVIGGCCGTTPDHIRAMRAALM
jgi:5-methyltetrahydrofolate--homocysteine methyltransferase